MDQEEVNNDNIYVSIDMIEDSEISCEEVRLYLLVLSNAFKRINAKDELFSKILQVDVTTIERLKKGLIEKGLLKHNGSGFIIMEYKKEENNE